MKNILLTQRPARGRTKLASPLSGRARHFLGGLVRTPNRPISGTGFLNGAGAALIIAAAVMAGTASQGIAKPSDDVVVLDPSGDPVEVVLYGVDIHSGISHHLTTENPPSYGFPILRDEDEVYFSDSGEDWVSRMYMTRDMFAIREALKDGGAIVMNPGVYNWNARIVYSKIISGVEVFQYTSMIQYGGSGRPWASALDYHMRGATSGAHGPAVKVVCDIFIHFAADLDRITTPTHIIENIHLDNAEWQEYCYAQGVFISHNTVLGWRGQADVTIKKCKFTGGGVTFHNDGKVSFEENVMENTYYGVQLTYPCDSDFFAARNKISAIAGAGIYSEYIASFIFGTTPKVIEIVDNEIEWSGFGGIGVNYTDASVLIQHNTTRSVPGIVPHFYGYYAGIGCWNCFSGALLKNNEVIGSSDLPNFLGINLAGTSGSTVQSNKISGVWAIPIYLDSIPDVFNPAILYPANSNVLLGNNLNSAIPVYGAHYYFDGTDYNVVRGGGAAGHNIVVLDNGMVAGSNLVTGLDHRIGQITQEEPYTSMKEAMSGKF